MAINKQLDEINALPYQWQGKPRRMAVAERLLWQWFQAQFPMRFAAVWYDVYLARSTEQSTELTRHTDEGAKDDAALWAALTALRADVIARSGSSFTVIELRWLASESIFGRTLRYAELARRAWPALTWTKPVLIVNDVATYLVPDGTYQDVELVIKDPSWIESSLRQRPTV